MSKEPLHEEKVITKREQEAKYQGRELPREASTTISGLQQTVGNRAVQRLLAQRSGEGSFELDDETTNRINQQRGGGQELDATVQANMTESTGHDFSGVKVHTDSESHALNEQLSAKAFTTGQDIFFREGAYQPGSSSGQELIAHELTHVVQQNSGAVGGGSRKMTVNPPGDRFEQEADTSARQVTQAVNAPQVQRQEPEEEEVQAKYLQRQAAEEEEEVQTKAVQRQEPEEEEVQAKQVQRQAAEDQEELQTKSLQREDLPEEEEEPVQAQEMDEDEEQV